MNITEKEIVEEKLVMNLFNCNCPKCGTASVGLVDANGEIDLKCWNCTMKKLYDND